MYQDDLEDNTYAGVCQDFNSEEEHSDKERKPQEKEPLDESEEDEIREQLALQKLTESLYQ